MSPSPFSQEIVDAVLRHMNGDHSDDNLLIARAFVSPDAETATMTGLNRNGGTWLVTSPGGASEAMIPWSAPVTERADIRREVVVLYDAACERLGVTPRPH
ncbi:hypothetical protein IWX78_001592 [Mycetocola sp. CAN_C7]|uniref:DUF2470 domain-containing protein n=1 Tax=Mycetocola sp. CAN_C7 TaxID=2787724 RepID=UPI0018CAF329